MRGVAFKATYNDGGAIPGGLVGFRGVCSDRVMLDNVRIRKMTNCSAENGPCRQFVDGNFIGARPSRLRRGPWCYESTLLSASPWSFGAGMYHRGARAGQAIPMTSVNPGDIAFLTTLPPGASQSERFIFALFRIGTLTTDEWGGNVVISDESMDIQIPDDIARTIRFWNYRTNYDGSEVWATGLHRYIEPDATVRLLGDVLGALSDRPERDTLFEALGGQIVPKPVRHLRLVRSSSPTTIGGFGPEGDAHRLLKEHVAANPIVVGLPRGAKSHMEFEYVSGDAVDIKFDLPDGSFVVVEIETIIPFPGAHQCIKYRALLEAEHGYPLNSGRVKAILVAHRFDEQTRHFAAQYGIRLVELKI